MCHQTCEKTLKAMWEYKLETMPPRTHNLRLLARELSLRETMGFNLKELLLTLEPLNIQARYPEDRKIMEQALTEPVCEQLVQQTEEWTQWISNKL